MSKVKIYQAGLADISAITKIKKRVWLVTYPNLGVDVNRDDVLKKDFIKLELGRSRNMVSNNWRYWLAKKDGQLAGYIAAKKEDIIVIKSPVGMPGRVIRNEFVKKVTEGAQVPFGCEYKCLYTCDANKVNYCIAKALLNAYRGDLDKGFAMCGSNAYRINKIVSVKELISELVTEAKACL